MKNRSRGFTLIELMTALLVLAILVGIAIPSFRDFAADSRMSSASSDLVTALNLARSEALRRSSAVHVCSSADLATCAGSFSWTTGWIVFADLDNDSVADANELLQTWTPLQGGVLMTSSTGRVIYDSMGMARMTSGPPTATFSTVHPSCAGRPNGRRSVVSPTGSMQTGKFTCP